MIEKTLEESLVLPEYDFLRNGPYAKDTIFLTYGGSIAYGTNKEGSDIDIRGIALNKREQVFGFDKTEQYEDANTDTIIYTLNKIFELFIANNPNVVEMLFTKPEHMIYNDLGKLIIDNRMNFLSKLAGYSFNGFALSQTHRLKNALKMDGKMSLEEELSYEVKKLNSLVLHFNHTRTAFDTGSMYFNLKDDKIPTINVSLKEYPAHDLVSIFSEINACIKAWNNVAKLKDRELTPKKLNKHAMHTIRLFILGISILEGKIPSTFVSDKEENKLLMDIRNGKFMKENYTYDSAYFDMVDMYQKRFDYALKNTSLPEFCNKKQIEELKMTIQEKMFEKEKYVLEF